MLIREHEKLVNDMTIEVIARYIGYLVAICGGIGYFAKVLKTMTKIADGQRCLMRSQITSTYYKHVDEEEPTLRQFERENLDKLFTSYSSLNGNSFVGDIYDVMRHWRVVN